MFSARDIEGEVTEDIQFRQGSQVPRGSRGIIAKQACDMCRKKKMKCDGASPMCSSCCRLGTTCQYQMMRGKSGPRKGHITALHNRLARMESLVEHAGVAANQASSTSTRSNTANVSATSETLRSLQDLNLARKKLPDGSLQALDDIFFQKVHPFVPIFHQSTFRGRKCSSHIAAC